MEAAADLDMRAAALSAQLKQREQLLVILREDGDAGTGRGGIGSEEAEALARLPAAQRVAAMEQKLADMDAELSALGSEADEVLVTPSSTPAPSRPAPPASAPADQPAATWGDVGGWGASAAPPKAPPGAPAAPSAARPSWLSAPDPSKASQPSLPMPKGPPSIPHEAIGRHASDIRITGTIEDPASSRPSSMQPAHSPPGAQPAPSRRDASASSKRKSSPIPQLPTQARASAAVPMPARATPPLSTRDVLLVHDGITAPWTAQGPEGAGAEAGRQEAEGVVRQIEGVLQLDAGGGGGGGGEAEVVQVLMAHTSKREKQLRAARGALELADRERRRALREGEEQQQRCGFAEREVERLRRECQRLEDSVGGEYARQDHLRAIQALQDTQAKLTQLQGAAARLEEEVRVRDEELAFASESLEALQESRADIRDSSVHAHGRVEKAEMGMREAVKGREEAEARMSEQLVSLEKSLREASSHLDLETHARKQAEAYAEALSQELDETKDAKRKMEEELREKISVQAVQIEEQEDEIDELHTRNMEMDQLVNEQQENLEEMIHNTLTEVAKREQQWIRSRSKKDERIEAMERKDEGAQEEARRATQAVDTYEKEFERREERRKEEVAALRQQLADREEELLARIAEKEQDILNRAAGASKRMAELERKDMVQAKQIEELMRHKAWLTKQLGIPALDM